jgi:hypothetical protein
MVGNGIWGLCDALAKFQVTWVVRVPRHITRITQNNFGFPELIFELVIEYFRFGYFGSEFGYFGFE